MISLRINDEYTYHPKKKRPKGISKKKLVSEKNHYYQYHLLSYFGSTKVTVIIVYSLSGEEQADI
jgi:hypothetical protein